VEDCAHVETEPLFGIEATCNAGEPSQAKVHLGRDAKTIIVVARDWLLTFAGLAKKSRPRVPGRPG
jgi:hypothetical protein